MSSKVHTGGVDQELRLPLATRELEDETGNQDHQQSNAAQLERARDEEQQRANQLQPGDEGERAESVNRPSATH